MVRAQYRAVYRLHTVVAGQRVIDIKAKAEMGEQ